MTALEGETNVIPTSGRTVRFVAISTICSVTLPKLGINVKFVQGEDPEEFAKLINDFEAICKIVHDAGIPVVIIPLVLASEYFIKPLNTVQILLFTVGATKWIGGHRTTIGGVVIDEGKFPWNNGRFSILTNKSPDYHGLIYWETFGYNSYTMKTRSKITRNIGPCQNPFYQYKFLNFITKRLESYPHHENAKKYSICGMDLTFGVKGDANVRSTLIDALQLDEKTLVIHPASTTHQQLTDEEQLSAGVNKEMIRVSVGYEHIDDIKEDFTISFEKIKSNNILDFYSRNFIFTFR
ncbi:PLP-dependent transferase [Rhizophagus irregularis]|uniref:PLP-dependent transferase n=1 Tax=Rhizophagus irregularis TaxID=588596 RepID=A0A2N1MPI7_9GLOM|nr:PLP-dependent transferase [Rhizophagus irregularis]